MTKLEDILSKHIDREVIKDWKEILYDNEDKDPDCVKPIYSFWTTLENGLKEYAEFYAKKCLEIAANETEMKYEKLDYHPSAWKEVIDKDSILNIKLPEHD